jgi:putative heme iron utilization protein
MADETETPATPIRPTDAEALKLADRLIRGARHVALGVIDAATGFPSVSRALVATDIYGMPVILISALSGHTKALTADPRASLLFGEPGKGDPLAHPRLTLQGRALPVERGTADHARLRARFIRRHPKAALYVDFGDFRFMRIEPAGASLNGGFGKAYELSAEDLVIRSQASEALAEMEEGALAHMNADHADAVAAYAAAFAGASDGSWKMTGFDAAGFEIASGDRLHRIAFDAALQDASELRATLVALARRARS